MKEITKNDNFHNPSKYLKITKQANSDKNTYIKTSLSVIFQKTCFFRFFRFHVPTGILRKDTY